MRQIFVLLWPLYALATTLTAPSESTIARHKFKRDAISILVQEVGSDSSLLAINSTRMRIPASVQKLYTGAAAMHYLGARHNFKTHIYLDSFDLSTGCAAGTTTIRGEGDPSLTAERIWLFATHLKQRGISQFKGKLAIDNSYFDHETAGPGFGNGVSSRAYLAPVTALSASFNALEIRLQPRSINDTALITTLPSRDKLTIHGTVTTAAKSSGISTSTFINGKKETTLKVTGTLGKKAKVSYRKIWDPAQHFAEVFVTACEEVGINCSFTDVIEQQASLGAIPFYSYESQALHQQIKASFKWSNNFVAESIFRTIAAEQAGVGSWKKGAELVSSWYKREIDSTSLPVIINGSGMGTRNRTSAKQVVTLLQKMALKPSVYYEFVSAMPISGIDGTLRKRLNSDLLKGSIRAKTGTLSESGVNNLAGYLFKNGKTYCFALLMQDKKSSYAHWQLQADLLEAILTELP